MGVCVPRRAGKTTVLLALAIGRCLTRPGYSVLFTAQSGTKASARFLEMARTLERQNPNDVMRGFRIMRGAGNQNLTFANGSIFQVLPPKPDAFRGDSGDLIILDEAQEHTADMSAELIGAILPTMDTRPGAVLVVAGTAGERRSGLFWDTLVEGRAGVKGVGIIQFAAPDTTTPEEAADPATWIASHPGIGTLTDVDTIAQRFERLPFPQFAREYLGIWPEDYSQSAIDMTSAYRSGSRSLFAEVVTRPEGRAATNLFAALTDVEYNSVGSVGVAAIQPAWIDELWSGRAYARKFIPLIGSGQLSAITVNAWRWTTKPAVASWSGNKNAVPSNAPATESYEVTATRLAGAHDIAREYRDFGNTSFFDSYLRAMTESYAKLSDEKALDDLVGAATVVAASGAGVWDRIVDGIEAVIDTTVPTFAIVANNMYRELLTTSNNDALAYLNASVGIESGTAAGFTIVPSASLSAGQVLVGSREAAIAYELPGSPVRVEGLDMVNGGIDVGLFGYYATVINSESALALVETD